MKLKLGQASLMDLAQLLLELGKGGVLNINNHGKLAHSKQ